MPYQEQHSATPKQPLTWLSKGKTLDSSIIFDFEDAVTCEKCKNIGLAFLPESLSPQQVAKS